nr:unnamed protein product [Digitaria exilis]
MGGGSDGGGGLAWSRRNGRFYFMGEPPRLSVAGAVVDVEEEEETNLRRIRAAWRDVDRLMWASRGSVRWRKLRLVCSPVALESRSLLIWFFISLSLVVSVDMIAT